MDAKNQSELIQDFSLRIPTEWVVRTLVLTSMLLQLLLVIFGARRYLSSSAVLRSIVWLSYISADVVAISALGMMMHNARNEIYGIWAPLLLHLGGSDAITAYSMADNELWLRHGFNMIYQVSVAVYVMYVSVLSGLSLASAILLLIVGGVKYAERTYALRLASYSHMVNSTLPIYKYMQQTSSHFIVMGESNNTRGDIISVPDVFESEIVKRDCYLCLSHALFKMYKRRFVSLYFNEGDKSEVREFFFSLSPREAFTVVEMELKFMYDALFSKASGTAFSGWGALVRLLNTLLLGVAGFLVFSGLRVRQAQRAVTYVLISVALMVEAYQLCRITVSDWTRVRLICARVHHWKRDNWCRLKLITIAMLVLGKIRNVVGDRYWNNRIHQYCLIQTSLDSSQYLWKLARFFHIRDSFIVRWYIKAMHIHTEPIKDDFRSFIFDILREKCSPDEDIEACRKRVYAFNEPLLKLECLDLKWASEFGLEDVILIWHIATKICEMEREGVDENENVKVRFSRILSRYCAYLLISHPNLLPLHPDIARIEYMELQFKLAEVVKKYEAFRDYRDQSEEEDEEKNSVLSRGAKLARLLLNKERNQRWEIVAEYWAGLVIYIGVYNKATFHAECLAGGGEFVSQLWVLLGHMGCGEQSDTAVTVRTEDRRVKDKEAMERKKYIPSPMSRLNQFKTNRF